MKERKTTEVYLTKKENKVAWAVFMGMTVVGAILLLLWVVLFVGIGILGFPLLFLGAGGLMFVHSSNVTDEDYDKQIERIKKNNGIEENDTTLKEYIIGKSEHIKRGKDKKIRTAFYCISVFTFKKEECQLKKYVIDLLNENVTSSECIIPIGSSYELSEKEYSTNIGDVKRHFLTFNDLPETTIPVNVKVYDTDSIIKRITRKR